MKGMTLIAKNCLIAHAAARPSNAAMHLLSLTNCRPAADKSQVYLTSGIGTIDEPLQQLQQQCKVAHVPHELGHMMNS